MSEMNDRSRSRTVQLTNAAVVLVSILAGSVDAQGPPTALRINFTASAESFQRATEEYRDIWESEGPRIVATMEHVTGLRFDSRPVGAVIYEGPSSSGFHDRPMQLRASYTSATKRATLVHELGHRLIGDLVPADFGTFWQTTGPRGLINGPKTRSCIHPTRLV